MKDDAQAERHDERRPPDTRPAVANLQQEPRRRQPRQGTDDHERSDRDLFGVGTIGGRIGRVDRDQIIDQLVDRRMNPLEKPGNIEPRPTIFRVRENVGLDGPSLLGDQLPGLQMQPDAACP